MGALTAPASGLVYLDANPVIYSVEKHSVFEPLLVPLWQAAQAKSIEIVSSELVLLETLVGPLKAGDTALAQTYEQLFQQPQTRLIPIALPVLREAARLRATTTLRTPDAIHAATSILAGCTLFVTGIRESAVRALFSLTGPPRLPHNEHSGTRPRVWPRGSRTT